MESTLQKKAFQEYEANQWFGRNKHMFDSYNGETDMTAKLIREYNVRPLRILEIGCSAGYRLNYLKKLFPDAIAAGVDLSSLAIEEGKKRYSGVELYLSAADDLSLFEDAYFDLVIVGFVFYVVDRSILFNMVKEIDRVLSDKGILINTDFYSTIPTKNVYHHITEFEAFSFKQKYEQIFLASDMYQLLCKTTFNHDDHLLNVSDNYYNKCSTTLLKKDIQAGYK